jgi:hypothetical protein
MIEEVMEAATGRWGLLALALVAFPGGRKFLRTAAKEVIRAGITVSERAQELAAEIKEEASDVVAEVRSERQQKNGSHEDSHKHAKAQGQS